MATEAQLNANRANAGHSTGPRTDEGKARSSQNNFRWGFAGSFRVLATENQDEFESLLAALRNEHNPDTPTEEIIVEKMAQHLWLSRRAQSLQDATLTDTELSPDEQRRCLALFLRYQTANDRGFTKCLNDLLKLRAEKRKQQIGFESQQSRERQRAERTELAQARTRLANAKAADLELDTEIRSMLEARLPGYEAIPFDRLKSVLSTSLGQAFGEGLFKKTA